MALRIHDIKYIYFRCEVSRIIGILFFFCSNLLLNGQVTPENVIRSNQPDVFTLSEQYEYQNTLEIPFLHNRFYGLQIIKDKGYEFQDIIKEEIWTEKGFYNRFDIYSRLDTFWLKCKILVPENLSKPYLLYLQRWSDVELYLPDSEDHYHLLISGTLKGMKDKAFFDPMNYFKWSLPDKDTCTIYAKVYSKYPNVSLPIQQEFFIAQVDEENYYQSKLSREWYLPFQGYLFAQVIYGLFIFLLVRERIIWYYFLLSLGNLITDMALAPNQTLFQLLPQFRLWQSVLVNVSIIFILYGAIFFVSEYINLHHFQKGIKRKLSIFFTVLGIQTVLNISIMYYDQLLDLLGLSGDAGQFLMMSLIATGSILMASGFLLILAIPIYGIYKKVRHSWILFTSTIFPAFSSFLFNIAVIASITSGQYSIYDSTLVGGDIIQFYPFIQMGIFIFITVFAILVGLKARQIIFDREKALNDQAKTERESAHKLKKVFEATDRFVPHEFIQSLGHEKITEVVLGDHVLRRVTVLFTDIRDYTTLSESMTPEDNFRFIKAFNSRMSPEIHKHHGFINQYLGDGIMALFPDRPLDALNAAIGMHKVLHQYNEERALKNRQLIRIGCGFHVGQLIMGVIGDPSRMDVATISDVVNTSARIEGLTKYYDANILMSDLCYADITDQGDPSKFLFRFLGRVKVKGKINSIGLYECINGDNADIFQKKKETLALFSQGVELYYNKDIDAASDYFHQVLSHFPEDRAAQLYVDKIESLSGKPLPEDWTGIDQLFFK